jgi:hypothetical protein
VEARPTPRCGLFPPVAAPRRGGEGRGPPGARCGSRVQRQSAAPARGTPLCCPATAVDVNTAATQPFPRPVPCASHLVLSPTISIVTLVPSFVSALVTTPASCFSSFQCWASSRGNRTANGQDTRRVGLCMLPCALLRRMARASPLSRLPFARRCPSKAYLLKLSKFATPKCSDCAKKTKLLSKIQIPSKSSSG